MSILHSSGVLHRDLNPANVLILESGHRGPIRCYLADFECNGNVVGTGFFWSPEVLQGVRMRDVLSLYQRHSDVYSFGMTCYESCTGLIPFKQEEVRMNHYAFVLEGRRPEMPGYIDRQVRELIERCWAAEPSLRPASSLIVKELDCIISLQLFLSLTAS